MSKTDTVLWESELADVRQLLLEHPIYAAMDSLPRVRVFMREHVFAVWDFMVLLKRLQQECTCVQQPWLPPDHPQLARFLNEIVLGEESDEDGAGGYCSHLELYLDAMSDCGADQSPIQQYLQALRRGGDPQSQLQETPLLPSTRDFVRANLELARRGAPHEVAAAFCLGREDIIPEMFLRLLPQLEGDGQVFARLRYYVRRHIELDGEEHGPLSRQLLQTFVGDCPSRTQEALLTAHAALQARIALWDGILAALP